MQPDDTGIGVDLEEFIQLQHVLRRLEHPPCRIGFGGTVGQDRYGLVTWRGSLLATV